MANSRVISAMQSLHVGPSPATGAQPSGSIVQLHRIQSIGFDFNVNRQDVTQFGQISPLSQEITDAPNVSLTASWLLNSAYNESGIGLVTNGLSGVISKIINGSERDKNYFIKIVPEGQDANLYGTLGNSNVIGIGNGFVASYGTSAAVGGFPTSNITVQGQNIAFSSIDTGFDSPAVSPSNGAPVSAVVSIPQSTTGLAGALTVLRPGDISVAFSPTIGFGLGNDACIQSYDISFDLSLQDKQCLGNRFPIAKNPTFPIPITMNLSAQVKDFGTGNLANIFCTDSSTDVTVTLRAPSCGTGVGDPKVQFRVLGAKLTSQPFSADLTSDSTVTLNYTANIGGPNDTVRNFIISGLNA